MENLLLGQFVPGDSLVHRMDARTKLTGFLLVFLTVLIASNWFGYVLAAAMTAAVMCMACLPVKSFAKSLKSVWPFLLMIFGMNAFFFSGTAPFWSWWIFQLTTAGMMQGLRVVVNVLFLMILSETLTSTTQPAQITSALESLLKPLKLFRVPVEDTAMILGIAIQFIPTLLIETDKIRKAQIARGARFEGHGLLGKATSVLPLVVPVFLSAFRRADTLSIAMESRGYCRAAGRTHRVQPKFTAADCLTLGICTAVFAIQLVVVYIL